MMNIIAARLAPGRRPQQFLLARQVCGAEISAAEIRPFREGLAQRDSPAPRATDVLRGDSRAPGRAKTGEALGAKWGSAASAPLRPNYGEELRMGAAAERPMGFVPAPPLSTRSMRFIVLMRAPPMRAPRAVSPSPAARSCATRCQSE